METVNLDRNLVVTVTVQVNQDHQAEIVNHEVNQAAIATVVVAVEVVAVEVVAVVNGPLNMVHGVIAIAIAIVVVAVAVAVAVVKRPVRVAAQAAVTSGQPAQAQLKKPIVEVVVAVATAKAAEVMMENLPFHLLLPVLIMITTIVDMVILEKTVNMVKEQHGVLHKPVNAMNYLP